MSKKSPSLTPPSIQSINLVLQAADAAPRPNGPTSRQVDAAVMELQKFFEQLLAPQIKSQTGSGDSPQASASGAGT